MHLLPLLIVSVVGSGGAVQGFPPNEQIVLERSGSSGTSGSLFETATGRPLRARLRPGAYTVTVSLRNDSDNPRPAPPRTCAKQTVKLRMHQPTRRVTLHCSIE
jgi:hypothetical protein